jgi:hypothetical protein
MCNVCYEIADILDETIPAVEVLAGSPEPAEPGSKSKKPERINAIDTPELFHVGKGEHRPKTEKKNGRFIVPDLLSRGIKKKRQKSRRRHRDRSETELAESLARLKENTISPVYAGGGDASPGSVESDRPNDTRERNRSESARSQSRRRGQVDKSKRVRKAGPTGSLSAASVSLKQLPRVADVKSAVHARMSQFGRAWTTNQENFRFQAIMVGVGALLAFPVLHLMLWWFIGVDPFGLARPTSAIFPFFVPHELSRTVDKDAETTPPVADDTTRDSSEFNRRFEDSIRDGKLPTPRIDPSSIHTDDY